LKRQWRSHGSSAMDDEVDLGQVLGEEAVAELDLFDALQLQAVLKVCRSAKSLSDAGRKLFAASREQKAKPNDADRLKKYLARFGLSWEHLTG
jgi:transcriptional regulatory protein RtcR